MMISKLSLSYNSFMRDRIGLKAGSVTYRMINNAVKQLAWDSRVSGVDCGHIEHQSRGLVKNKINSYISKIGGGR